MALVSCPDCGARISDAAPLCPNCGRPISNTPAEKKKTSVGAKLGAIVGIAFLVALTRARLDKGARVASTPPAEALDAGETNAGRKACSVADIAIKSIDAKFVDRCRRTPCPSMKGLAVLTNHCAESVGVQIKITGYNKNHAPLATRDLWPASINNIPPGDYTFSLDTWLDYDPAIKTFDLVPISVKRWK